jgi:hypothetical protein
MAIGKPLLITEKQPVQTPVLAAQTTPLSPNVAAQKLSFADYGIGQANAKASFAVTDELINMAGAMGKSAMYIAQTKNAHKKVQIEEQFKVLQRSFNSDIATTHDLVGRENLYATYMEDMKALTSASAASLMTDPESQQFLASMSSESNTIGHSVFTKIESQRFSETKSGLEASIAAIESDVKSNANTDLRASINKVNGHYASLNSMGALPDSAFEVTKFTKAQSLIIAKATRMGRTEGEQYKGGDYDTAEEKFEKFEEYLADEGITATASTKVAFKDAYSTALAKAWNADNDEEKKRENYLETYQREWLDEKELAFTVDLNNAQISFDDMDEYARELEKLWLFGEAEKVRKLYDSKDKAFSAVVDAFMSKDGELFSGLQKAAHSTYGDPFKFSAPNVRRYLMDQHNIDHEPTVQKIIADAAQAGRGTAKDYIDGPKRTDALGNFFLNKTTAGNVREFMTQIGMSHKEQELFKIEKLATAKNVKGILSALEDQGPKFKSVVSKMKSIISGDGHSSAKNTPFAVKTRKLSSGGTEEYDPWWDRAETKEFRSGYDDYIETVFSRASKELTEGLDIDVDAIRGENIESQAKEILKVFKNFNKNKEKMGNNLTLKEEIVRWLKNM